ncbi:Type II secretion system (T2SS), protein F [uncultured archaeon]|nr:Type II secretion system (T2SS), protein F [uncultured archaeon]
MGQKYSDRHRAPVSPIQALFPSLKYNLKSLGVTNPEAYVASSVLSAFISAALLGVLLYFGAQSAKDVARIQSLAIAASFGLFLTLFIFNMYYPGIKTKSYAAKMDRDLAFALKDMLVQVESGIPLYESMVNIAHSNYGLVSVEFTSAVKEISAGAQESRALQQLALKSKSEYFRKALWQLVSTLESGASIGPALRSVIETLESYQHKSIKDYSATLNFVVLIYMLSAAAIPSMGMTFLIVLSAFGGIGVNESLILAIIGGSLLFQLVLIGFMNSGRPAVYE